MKSNNSCSWLILFGGKGREGTIHHLLANNVAIECVIVPQNRNSELDASINELREIGISVIETSQSSLEKTLLPFAGRHLLSIGFPYLLKEQILKIFARAINLHPTLLPRYRGPNSGAHVILNGENEAGSTVHIMTPQVDEGPIILQRVVKLSPFETTRSMQRKVYEIEPQLVLDAIKILQTSSVFVEQNNGLGSYFRKRVPEDSEVNPSKSLLQLFDEIRASDSEAFPAFFYVDGQKVCIKLWRPDKPENEADLI